MSIKIGGGVIGRYGRVIAGTTSAEIRLLQNDEHKYSWQDIKFCLDNNIFCIVNIDTYLTGGRWRPSNQVLRDFTIATKNTLRSIGANKFNCRFTWDNESLEYTNLEDYYGKLRVIHDALAGQFDLGAGNFRTSMMTSYSELASKYSEGYFEVFDIHYQDGMVNVGGIDYIAGKFNAIAQFYNIKRVAVTEGNNFWNVSTPNGHNLLKHQINVAESYGCEDFCFPFVNWTTNTEESHSGMSYCENDIALTDNWGDMLNVIKIKKPIVEDEMTLDKLYMRGSRGIGVKFIQKVVNAHTGSTLLIDGIWGTLTEDGVRAFQEAKGLQVDGKVGVETFPAMIEEYPKIWNQIEYAWSYRGKMKDE
jgi:hypothetical protein